MPEELKTKNPRALAEYCQTIRTELNKLQTSAQVLNSGNFESKNGPLSTAADLLSKISSLVPVIGQPASAVFSLASFGAKQLENARAQAAAEEILAVSCGDSTNWNTLTKELSRELGTQRTKDLKNSDKEDAKKLAKADLAKIVAKILTGDLPNIEHRQDLFEALKTAALAPSPFTIPKSFKKASLSHEYQIRQ
jgi:hypothetical protein